jgi:peptidoglycan/LPS O-acetylase OafA/YrhL
MARHCDLPRADRPLYAGPRGRRKSSFYLLGQHGVAIFFVLSGFLITSILLNEKEAAGGINLRGFYIRRIFRLVPAAWCYLGFVGAMHWHFAQGELASSLFFYRNYIPTARFAAHFWSLSIEEQFYIFWAVMVMLIPKRWLLCISSLGAFAVAFHRAGHWDYFVSTNIMLTFRTELRADALFVGCALAILMREDRFRSWIQRIPPAPLLGLLALCFYFYQQVIPLRESIVIALLIGTTILRSTPILQWKPLCILGELSYSIYVWQEIGALYTSHHLDSLPLGIAMAASFGLISYYCVEQPMRTVGRHIAHRFSHEKNRRNVPAMGW